MEAAGAAKTYMSLSDYPNAVRSYSKAILEYPNAPTYYVDRAIAHHKMKNYLSALADSEKAILLALDRGSKSIRATAQFRRSISLYCLGRYHDALYCLQIAKRDECHEKAIDIWLAKAKSATEGALRPTHGISEIPKTEFDIPAKNAVKIAADEGLLDCDESNENISTVPEKPGIRHDWYETGDRVIITLYARGLAKDDCNICFEPRQISVTLLRLQEREPCIEVFAPLSGDILPEESFFKLMATKIEISARKVHPGKWSKLLDNAGESSAGLQTTQLHRKDRNWDSFADYTDEEPVSDGDAALTNLFQTLYKDADEDTRKAMIKSYTESGGTSLSTDWNSVKQKKVEIQPPDGMQACQYGK
ncbi:SGT1-like protein Git7 [Taphrina deformans PYCC 5710]|uniref:SGT1-like protein Git7 n=1 Tax=Taphrina deformans (strain PYCC 5710 / ATCC 11124 / CBS 356.35 / IMI 108563 / JCM 9778 / NBRC 8474) TaxID=1097556 RepID=R4X8H1_TAPDE|nr:SGT1-like protein Git7 [Taphrina deformans PYCC 5710]|eukprot:CCG81904.1 SGT1-like protein Git7 [Taphrina deformans PYCC 5710]